MKKIKIKLRGKTKTDKILNQFAFPLWKCSDCGKWAFLIHINCRGGKKESG